MTISGNAVDVIVGVVVEVTREGAKVVVSVDVLVFNGSSTL